MLNLNLKFKLYKYYNKDKIYITPVLNKYKNVIIRSFSRNKIKVVTTRLLVTKVSNVNNL